MTEDELLVHAAIVETDSVELLEKCPLGDAELGVLR